MREEKLEIAEVVQNWAVCYDFFEKRAGKWAIVRRQPIYDEARLHHQARPSAAQGAGRRAPVCHGRAWLAGAPSVFPAEDRPA